MRPNEVALEKRIQLASSVGAALAGIGVGAAAARWLGSATWALIVVGIVLHAWSMLARRQREAAAGTTLPAWSEALYRVCWVILALIVVWQVATRWR
ncbi:MAG: hypothetical protein MUF53_08955 [Gemmatimonadaceae bacterium]|jgi:hypothetical protein|nr:hypothetical protein [Gemmatimonadaceae bacterium]